MEAGLNPAKGVRGRGLALCADAPFNLARVGSRGSRKGPRRSTDQLRVPAERPQGRLRKAGREELNHERPKRSHWSRACEFGQSGDDAEMVRGHATHGEQPSSDVIGCFCVRPDEIVLTPGVPGVDVNPPRGDTRWAAMSRPGHARLAT